MTFKGASVSLVLAAGLTLAGTASAGEAQKPSAATKMPEPQVQQKQAQISDETVKNFAAAYTDVRAIHKEYSQKAQSAKKPEATKSLQQEAQKKMKAAIENNDITVQQYQKVGNQLNSNNNLRQRVQQELQASTMQNAAKQSGS